MQSFSKVKVFVAGDVMLDRFEYGNVKRISPEAPVPVFLSDHVKSMPGGVGNVAANLRALGCQVTLAGRVGTDEAGAQLEALLTESGVKTMLLKEKDFTTVVKTRLIAGNNHLLRADREEEVGLRKVRAAYLARLTKAVAKVDVVLLSDYAKGFLTYDVCQAIIKAAEKAKKPVLIDPKGTDWKKYRGATLVKPNLKELSLVSGANFQPNTQDFFNVVTMVAHSIGVEYGIGNILTTLSERGMLLASDIKPGRHGRLPYRHVAAKAHEVFDVSGAGDTALAAFGAAIGAGETMTRALELANAASGIVVSKLGTATVSAQELATALDSTAGVLERMKNKIVDMGQIRNICAELHARGKRIGFTNGCFDCCHPGHIYSLMATKELCDVLVVGMNSDASVRRHKGPNRPIQNESSRAVLLASLAVTDYVVMFDEDVPLDLVKAIKPDVIAKEGYPLNKWPEGQLVKKMGGEAVELKRLEGFSTTALVARMQQEERK